MSIISDKEYKEFIDWKQAQYKTKIADNVANIVYPEPSAYVYHLYGGRRAAIYEFIKNLPYETVKEIHKAYKTRLTNIPIPEGSL